MSQLASSDSLNGRRSSGELSRDPVSPTALRTPSTPPRAGPEPGVVQRSSCGGSEEPGEEDEFFQTPMSNGCFTRYPSGVWMKPEKNSK